MAFTGTAVVTKVSDRKFKISGLSLFENVSGTVGFTDKTVAAEVSLEAPTWQPDRNSEGDLVSLKNGIEARISISGDITVAVPISVVMTGTDHGDFVMTFHNDALAPDVPVASPFDIFVEYH